MEKILTRLLLVLLCATTSFAQAQAKDDIPESQSKTIEFLKASGSFFVKEFYDLPKVSSVECQVLIITNVVSGKKIGCLRLTTKYNSQYSSDDYIGTLDSDEIEDCIKSLTYIKDTLLPSTPTVYTEAVYKTKDGVKLGAYYDEGKWKAYVYTKGYTSRSACFLKSDNIETFINVMNSAQQLIAEKTKKTLS